MNEIKPIETCYNGYRFRSRLEARWAVFFDALDIKYIYEPEGYELSDGSKYLPDFYLPELDYYAEVKGKNEHLINDLKRIERFVCEKKAAAIILSEIPYNSDAKGLYWFPIWYFQAKSKGCCHCVHAFFQTYGISPIETIIQDDFYVGEHSFSYIDAITVKNNDIEIAYRKIQAICGDVLDDDIYPVKEAYDLSKVDHALLLSRQARFEHGETPKP